MAFGSISAFPIEKERTRAAQIQFAAITVNGRTLSGPNSSAQRLNGRISVPAAAIARSLGDSLNIEVAAALVTVRRTSGIIASFDHRAGQVRENGSLILTVRNTGEINFSPNQDEFMLPIEIASSLFDIAIRYESDKNLVVITRGAALDTSAGQAKLDRPGFELNQLEYEYNLNRYAAVTAHNLVLLGSGRIADGRFTFTSNSSRSARGISLQTATINVERPNGQHFVGGNFGSGEDLQLMSINVRGFAAKIPVGSLALTAFGGQAFSGSFSPFSNPEQSTRTRSRFDTVAYGAYVGTPRTGGPFSVFGGAMRFSSASRRGSFATAHAGFESARMRLQSDVGYGIFEGSSQPGQNISGTGAAVDLTGTFQLRENLAIQARYTNIGRNFLSPQSGIREALDLKAAGISWAPARWFSSSLNLSVSKRPGDSTQNNKFVTAAFAITPSARAPRFNFSHTQSSTSQIRSAAFTTLSASHEFSRLRLYANATRIKNNGPATLNTQIGANIAVNDTNSIELSHGFGRRRSYNGQFDWRTSSFLYQKLNFTVGAGYSYSPVSGYSAFQRLGASVSLPRQASLQVNYYNTNQGATLLVSLRGSIFKRRESASWANLPVSEINSFGKISGRVYLDTNLNGQFDERVDKPQAEVKVRVDGNRYAVSDANGVYELDSISAGEHSVYVDLLSVRADLTLLSEAGQNVKLQANHDSKHDFRLVRTGRLSGRVWFDADEDGESDDGETPLSDVRVVTASGRDTLTDSDGNFTIGDLPPGEHTIFLDAKTLPQKMSTGQKSLVIRVIAGHETTDNMLTVIRTPAEVKRFAVTPN